MINDSGTSMDDIECIGASPRSHPRAHHARVFEGVAKSQCPPQGSGFQKSKAWITTLLNDLPPPTLWRGISLPPDPRNLGGRRDTTQGSTWGYLKSQCPPQGSGFHKSKAWITTLLNELPPPTLWRGISLPPDPRNLGGRRDKV